MLFQKITALTQQKSKPNVEMQKSDYISAQGNLKSEMIAKAARKERRDKVFPTHYLPMFTRKQQKPIMAQCQMKTTEKH